MDGNNNNDLHGIGVDMSSGSKIRRQGQQRSRKSKQRSLLETHFETVIILLRLRMNSYEKCLFLLILLTLLMIVTNMNNYFSLLTSIYPNISQSSIGFSLMQSMRYVDIAQMLNIAGSQASSIVILCAIYMLAMTLCYVVCCVNRFQNPLSKPRKYFFGRWFVNMSSYFVQILSFPFAVIFLAFVFCSKSVLENADQICGANASNASIIVAFAVIGIVLVFVNEIWLQLFFYNTKLYKKDSMRVDKDATFLLESSAMRMIFAVFTCLQGISQSYGYMVLFLAVQVTYLLYVYVRISFMAGSFTFANAAIQSANQSAIIVQLAQFLAFLADAISRASDLYAEDQGEKVIVFFAAFSFFLLLISPKIREKQIQRYLFNSHAQHVQKLSVGQLHFKVSMFQHLNSQTSSYLFSDALFKGILNEHLMNPCAHPNNSESCFCKLKILYDPKKKKDTPLDKAFLSMNNGIFAKFIVKSWYEIHLHANQASTNDYISYLAYSEFLYFKMKNVSLALRNLAVLDNKYLTPMQTFRFFRLKQTIIKFNRKRNHAAYRINLSDKDHRNKLEIEAVIPVEEQITAIQAGIKFIIKNNIRFWAYLEKSNVNLNELNNLTRFSLKQLDSLQQLWKDCMYYVDYRKKWRFYYCWYYLFILNQKLKISMLERFAGTSTVNENDVFSEEIQQEQNMDDDVVSVHSNLKADEMERILIKKVELAFDKRSVVFRVNHEIRGKIISVNRAIYHSFGYSALELSGQVSITTLMPRIYQNVHPQLMQNFTQTGKTKTLYSQRKIFCLTKQGYVFCAWKFVKQFVTLTGKCEYISMIRRITPPAGTKVNYLILTEDWEIDSMSQDFFEGFGLNALQYQNQSSHLLLNLLILSPRLIRFTKFVKYLTEIDYKQFQSREANQAEHRKKLASPSNVKGFAMNNLFGKYRKDNSAQDLFLNASKSFNSLILDADNQNPKNTSPVSQQSRNPLNFQLPPQSQQQQQSQQPLPNLLQAPMTPPGARPSINITQPSAEPLMPSQDDFRRKQQKKATVIASALREEVGSEVESRHGAGAAAAAAAAAAAQAHEARESQFMRALDRKNSTNEMLEQLNLGQNAQFLQPKFIREEMMKKRFREESQLSGILPDEDDDQDKPIEGNSSDYEDESNKSQGDDNFGNGPGEDDDEEGGGMPKKLAFEKMEQFERGDQVSFRIRIPSNLNEMMNAYYNRASQIGKKQPKFNDTKHNSQLSANGAQRSIGGGGGGSSTTKSIKNVYLNQETGAVTGFGKTGVLNNPALAGRHENRDKQIYSVIRDTILSFQLKKSAKEFSTTCTAQFKKSGKQKIIILKFSKFDESLKKNRGLKQLLHQAAAAGGAGGVGNEDNKQQDHRKLMSFNSSVMDTFQKQMSHMDRFGHKRMHQFQSMASEISEAQNNSLIFPSFMNNNLNVYRGGAAPNNSSFSAQFGQHNNNNNTPENSKIASDNDDLQRSSLQAAVAAATTATDAIVAANAIQKIGKNNGMGYQLINNNDSQNLSLEKSGLAGVAGAAATASGINGNQSERSLKTFHKDFINRQGAKNISLSQNENMYIKEDNNCPNPSIKTISNLKAFLRLFFLTLIVLNAFTFFYGPSNSFPTLRDQSNKIFQTKNVLLSMQQAYDLILDQILVNKDVYDAPIAESQFWNTQDYQTLIKGLFADECNYFYTTISDTDYKQTFFDKSINPYGQYSKELFIANSLTNNNNNNNAGGITQKEFDVDTYDLFSQLIFSLQTVQETSPENVSLDLLSVNFFRVNAFPSLYDGLKLMQKNLLDELQSTSNTIYKFLIVMIIVESFLVVVSFVLLFHLIIVICNAFKSVVEVFPKISHRDLRKIKLYNINLNRSFSYIIEKDDFLSGTHSIFQQKSGGIGQYGAGMQSEHDGTENGIIKKKHTENLDLDEPNDGNENIGKKSKDVVEGGFLQDLRIRILSLFGVFIIFVVLSSAGLLLLILQSTSNVQLILDNGEIIMDSFGDNITMMISIKEKTIAPAEYTSTMQAKFQTLIDEYLVKNLQPHVQDLSFMQFDDDFNSMFYADPCTAYASLLSQEKANQLECEKVAQSSITKGIASFNAFFKNAIQAFVAGNDDTVTLDARTIFEYSRGVYFVNIFEVQLIQTWGNNTYTYLSNQLSIITIYVVLMFLVLFIVYLVVTERMLIGRFNKEYNYFKTVYSMFMPDFIIVKEKRIKFWLVKHFILNK